MDNAQGVSVNHSVLGSLVSLHSPDTRRSPNDPKSTRKRPLITNKNPPEATITVISSRFECRFVFVCLRGLWAVLAPVGGGGHQMVCGLFGGRGYGMGPRSVRFPLNDETFPDELLHNPNK